MSEERELLKAFIDFVDSYEFYPTERNIVWEIVNRTQELLAQPEYIPNVRDMVERIDWLEDQLNQLEQDLYPKRKPLEYGATSDMFHANKQATNAVCYWSGIKDAEKYHKIGE